MQPTDFTWAEMGNRIRSLRLAKGLTQIELAAASAPCPNGHFLFGGRSGEPQGDNDASE
jgi:hypothetical protein